MTERDAIPPAMGERRAIGGYHPQYRVAAGLILRTLRDGTLDSIRVADPEAGRVDDIQVATARALDAYQVKWSRFPQTITFNDLVRSTTDHPSLIRQLADGWRRLTTQSQRRVTVHLLTDDFPSTNDHVPGASRPNIADHFAAFLADAWQPKTQDRNYPLPERWSQAWGLLASASGFDPKEFDTFVTNCRFDVAYRLPDDLLDETDVQRDDAAAWKSDLDQLQLAMYSVVADKRQIVQLSRDELLDRLGWRERLEFRSRHEFPPTAIPYEEITGTAAELFQALRVSTGGYVILLGTPGSGKSTLLSNALRYRPERVVRYYAYVPETLEPSSTRGEAINFLHDMVLALEQLGFRSGQALIRNDLPLLAARFLQQLQQLHDDYVRTGQKTILVVDGLDHIAREQAPSRSLLRELPRPDQVPEGVYIVLGSQTDQLAELPPPVRVAIEELSRRIQMRLLSPIAVQSIVERSGLPSPPTGQQVGRIYELSAGHPLALGYVINQLRIHGDADVDRTLSKIEPYRNHIDLQYVSHWQQVEGDRELVHLLALLSRIRGAIDLQWVERWANKNALYQLQRQFKHYFRIEPDNRWYFFHNSFRAFLTEKTRQLPGVSSAAGDVSLFAELATHSAAASPESTAGWDELYYRAAAQDHAGVKLLTDPSGIRAQFLAGRPVQSIRADIRRAYASVGATRDLVLLARLCLLASEYNVRESNLEHVPVTEMLLALREDRVAIDRLREGQQLRVSDTEGLQSSMALLAAGLEDEAERIFTLAEPLELLSRATPIPSHQHDETVRTLTDWIEAAIHFRSVEQILTAIDRLQIDETQSAFRNETTESLRNQLRFELVRALLAARRWNDAERVYSEWRAEEHGGHWFWSQVQIWQEATRLGEPDRALAAVDAARMWADRHVIDTEERLTLAEAVLRLRGDALAASTLTTGIRQPALADGLSAPVDAGFQPFRLRFQLNRLLAALGQERPVRECVPDARESREEGLVLFERQVCVVARLFGRAWAGRMVPAHSFVNEALGVLRLFNRPYPHEWTTWYLAQAGRTELYRLLVRAASLHGADVIDALRQAFEQEWDDPRSKPHWPPDLVRNIVVALSDAGADVHWYLEALFAHAGELKRPNLSDLIPSDPTRDNDVSLTLCRWIARYLDYPANALARSAQRSVIELLEARNEAIQSLVRNYLDDDPTELGLITLRAAALDDQSVVAPFAEQLAKLTAARHFGVRRQAHWLLAEIAASGHGAVPVAIPPPKQLPATYELAYGRRQSRRIVDTPVRSEEFLPPSDDAAELIRPWNPEAAIIAKLANVQPEALYQRTAQLMEELGGPHFDDAERELRGRLDRMELKLGFRRPRAALAQNGIERFEIAVPEPA